MSSKHLSIAISVLLIAWNGGSSAFAAEETPDFSAVYRILDERCIECHATGDFEGGLVLESHATLMKGGESGAAIVARKSGESLLIRFVRGEVEKDGKRKFMPPGKRDKLSPEEVQLIARWIDAGAEAPIAGANRPRELNVPKVAPRKTPRNAVTALAGTSNGALFAVGRYATIELRDGATHALVRELTGHKGNVNALAFAPDGTRLFAASGENGLTGEIKIWSVSDGALLQTIEGHRDTLYSLALSPNGMILASGSYDQQIKLWDAQTGAELKTLRGHNGAVFSLAFRPDGKLLASASADRTVKIWDVATGHRRDTLSQPTKEQMRVAWSSDGKQLAAAGFDNRIRIWEVSEEGKETTNPLLIAKFAHEQPILQLVWSGDGKTVATGAQDGSVKVWDAVELKERVVLEKQPDWPSGLVFLDHAQLVVGRLDGTFAKYDAATGKGTATAAGTISASAGRASKAVAAGATSGEGAPKSKTTAKAKPKVPVINTLHPRGIQRGHDVEVNVTGTDLDALTMVKFTDARLRGEIVAIKSPNEATLKVGAPGDLERGSYEFLVGREGGEMSRPARIFVDDLPQLDAGANARTTLEKLPVSVWGVINKPGTSVRFDFDGQSGETLVFDLASKAVGSKADAVLSITDADGHVLATNNDFDSSGDPLLAHTFAETGRYTVVVSDSQFGGSAEHFYRLSAGELPFVTACFPLSIPMNAESEVELIGYHIPANRKLKMKAGPAGELALPIDPKLRSRRVFKVVVSELAHHALESEPNNTPSEATPIQVPGSAGGVFAPAVDGARQVALVSNATPSGGRTNQIDQRRVPQGPVTSPLAPVVPAVRANSLAAGADVDLFRFEARKGATWVIETEAARRGSPTDTKIEVLDAQGKPVERLLLQAVRDSAITFRPIDSATNDARVDNWREMELNELMFMGGEVVKIFRMPEGPDSGFQFYSLNGKRQAYFNTTPTAHALDEPCYIVAPHPPGTRLISNGLPVFPLYYANDDDGDRQLGTDSRLLFTAPADGAYLVAVSDSRGLAGDRYVYRLIVRAAKRDFAISAAFASQTINAASGQGFTINADRRDGFDGAIDVELTGAPSGFIVSTPLRIEAGHQAAQGSFFALPGAKAPTEAEWAKLQIVASAAIDGAKVVRSAQLPAMIKVGGAPQVYVALEPAAPGDTLERLSKPTSFREPTGNEALEITIAPGEIVPAWIKVRRNGHAAELRFDVENLPHGVIVDNLGLNGITLLEGQNEGEIALKAAPWVAETDRLCHAVTREVGKQTSLPVMLHIRKKAAVRTVEVR